MDLPALIGATAITIVALILAAVVVGVFVQLRRIQRSTRADRTEQSIRRRLTREGFSDEEITRAIEDTRKGAAPEGTAPGRS